MSDLEKSTLPKLPPKTHIDNKAQLMKNPIEPDAFSAVHYLSTTPLIYIPSPRDAYSGALLRVVSHQEQININSTNIHGITNKSPKLLFNSEDNQNIEQLIRSLTSEKVNIEGTVDFLHPSQNDFPKRMPLWQEFNGYRISTFELTESKNTASKDANIQEDLPRLAQEIGAPDESHLFRLYYKIEGDEVEVIVAISPVMSKSIEFDSNSPRLLQIEPSSHKIKRWICIGGNEIDRGFILGQRMNWHISKWVGNIPPKFKKRPLDLEININEVMGNSPQRKFLVPYAQIKRQIGFYSK